MVDIRKEVEAILFIKGDSVTVDDLAKLLKVKNKDVISETIKDIKRDLDSRDSTITLVETHKGWKMGLKNDYVHVAKNVSVDTELSKSLMETLAVIAWKQPATQSDIIKVRTNKAYDEVKQLLEMGFIQKERYGRTYLIRVTQKFFDYFDLPKQDNVKDLFKDVKGLEALQKDDVEEKRLLAEELGPDAVGIKTYGSISTPNEIKKAEQLIGEHLGNLEVFDEPMREQEEVQMPEVITYNTESGSGEEPEVENQEVEQSSSEPNQEPTFNSQAKPVQDDTPEDGLTDLFRKTAEDVEDLPQINLSEPRKPLQEEPEEELKEEPDTAEIDDNEGKVKKEEEPNEHGDLSTPVHSEPEDHGDLPKEDPNGDV